MAMASFAAQLKDMVFVLVERVTGYGGRAAPDQQDAAGAHEEPTKLASVSRMQKVVIVQQNGIRSSASGDPFVSAGSQPQVNNDHI